MSYIDEFKLKQKKYNNVVKACQHLLISSKKAKEARNYIDSRLSREQQLYWKIGYFPDDDNLKELLDIISKEDLESLNLYYPKYLSGGSAPHGHFSDHNLIVPFYNVHKEVVSLIGRCILSEEERVENLLNKYKYSNKSRKELYSFGLDRAKEAIIDNDLVIGVEGQFDCISLHNHGIKNVVAFGWANISKYQMFQISRYSNNIVLLFDNDDAGKKGRARVKKRFKDFVNIKTVSPPDGYKDIDEFLNKSDDKKYVSYVIDTIRSFWSFNGKENK